MPRIQSLPDPLGTDVRINVGALQRFVAQLVLDDFAVEPGLQSEGGPCVAEHVRGNVNPNPAFGLRFRQGPEEVSDGGGVNRVPVFTAAGLVLTKE